MQENGNADGDSDKTEKNDNRAQHKVVWRIVTAGVVGVIVVLFVSVLFPNLTERTKFFTANALSVLVIDVIIVQAYIYRRQWEVMKTQERVLERQAKAFEAQVIAMQGQLIAISRQADIMNETMFHSQRAYVSIARVSIDLAPRGANFLLKIENTGNTPAHDAEICVSGEIRDSAPEPERHQQDWITLGLIGPRQYVEKLVHVGYTHEQAHLMEDLKLRLYCWGIVRYETFAATPNLEFCFHQVFGGNMVATCPGGNRETWE